LSSLIFAVAAAWLALRAQAPTEWMRKGSAHHFQTWPTYDGALLVVSHDETFLDAIDISCRLVLGATR